ncbi:serine/arginine repetitive matrix protein 2 [Glutamicibacter halophytocola]|uniref:EcsC family protein n=1 Tax=Glutamicibacter halophytocola TaxID=1933880 RepID=UPI0006D4A022|nr:EcsC family protein [Glutamicibacter halophytocola]ALG30880.1 serine/arginine repetitive matrix protein 2 [Glutamicibacter halophytocola]
MTEPSEYELAAWHDLEKFKGRPLSQMLRNVGEQASTSAEKLGDRATQFLEKRPSAQAALVKGQEIVGRGAIALTSGARKTVEAIPEGLTDWSASAMGSMRRTVGRISRVGLSPQKVVSKHKKRGHEVASLRDLRRLDLQQIDAVRGQGASWGYPIAAALSGMGAGLVISGGELAIPVTGGVAAAPSGAAVAGAMIGDAAGVLALSSRAVGHVSLLYGYDPEDPAEKVFIMSVVNAGTAMSAGAKTAALADISRLTQALVRGKAWTILDKSIVTQLSKQFAKRFTIRLTKQGLGKVVPLAGIAIGGAFNWSTLESIVDTADVAYRRRFLSDKYPQFSQDMASGTPIDEQPEYGIDTDEVISVLEELADVGGPDLGSSRSPKYDQ